MQTTKKPKRAADNAMPPRLIVRRVAVGVKIAPGDHTGGRDGYAYGDLVTELHVQGGRSAIADRLEALASIVRSTEGDDVVGGEIFLLLRHRAPEARNG